MKPTVAFILSTRHSGSHLLAQLLGSHSRCLSIGELASFAMLRAGVNRHPELVHDYATNPYFAGLSALPSQAWHARTLANVRAYRPETTVLIDSSKDLAWAQRCAATAELDAVYVHLVRDPRAIVWRALATYDTPRARLSERRRLLRRPTLVPALFGTFDQLLLRKWLLTHTAITRHLAAFPRSAIVLYDDVVRAPAEALAGLMPLLGLAFETRQLAYGRVAHAGTLKRAYLGASARSLIAPDLRWRAALSEAVIARIEESRALANYLAQIGLVLAADGLRRR